MRSKRWPFDLHRNLDAKKTYRWRLLIITAIQILPSACVGVTRERALQQSEVTSETGPIEPVVQPPKRAKQQFEEDILPDDFFNEKECQWDHITQQCRMSTPTAASFFSRIEDQKMQNVAFSLEDCRHITDKNECADTPACQWFFSACEAKLFSPESLVKCYGEASSALLQACHRNEGPKSCKETAGCSWPDSSGFRGGCVFESSDFLDSLADGRFEGDLDVQVVVSKRVLQELKQEANIVCISKTERESCTGMCHWIRDKCRLSGAAILKRADIKRRENVPKWCELTDYILIRDCMGISKRNCNSFRGGSQCTWVEKNGCVPSSEAIFRHILDTASSTYLDAAIIPSSKKLVKEFNTTASQCLATSEEKCKE